jgi:predicted HAD superfamily Cof-like phosphohydrolase
MEEALEFAKATDDQNWVEIIDAICDLLYVTYGAAIAMGIDINPFFEEVHRSNMSKLDPVTGRPIYREDGKILKPSTYSPADLKKVLLRLYGTAFVQEENKAHE